MPRLQQVVGAKSQQKTTIRAIGALTGAIATVAAILLVVHSGPSTDLSGFSYRKKITIDAALIAGAEAHLNFPLLVHISHNDFRHTDFGGKVSDFEGKDLAFGRPDQSEPFPHDLEAYDPVLGVITAWVRIDTLRPGGSNELYVFYRHQNPPPSEPVRVWEPEFLAVWHLNENYLNSGPAGPALTPQRVSHEQTGLISGGVRLRGNGNLSAGNLSAVNNATTLYGSVWAKTTVFNRDGALMAKDTWGGASSLLFWRDEVGATSNRVHTFSVLTNGPKNQDRRIEGASNRSNDSLWHHIAFVFEGGKAEGLRLYIDGQEDPNGPVSTQNSPHIKATSHPFLIGSAINRGGFTGVLDEARLSHKAKSAGWIQTEYNNQVMPGRYLTLGEEEINDAASLPVEFGDLSAAYDKNSGAVLVSWSTLSELNNEGFEVEKSEDGRTFEYLKFIPGAGTSRKPQAYQFPDKWISSRQQRLYYRIRQIDFDGASSYSSVVEAILPERESQFFLSAHPNPFRESVTVRVTSGAGARLRLQLLTLDGRVMASKSADVPAGDTELFWAFPDQIPAGTYVLQALAGGNLAGTVKLIRQ